MLKHKTNRVTGKPNSRRTQEGKTERREALETGCSEFAWQAVEVPEAQPSPEEPAGPPHLPATLPGKEVSSPRSHGGRSFLRSGAAWLFLTSASGTDRGMSHQECEGRVRTNGWL